MITGMKQVAKIVGWAIALIAATAVATFVLNIVLPEGLGGRGPFDNFWAAICIVAVAYYLLRRLGNPPAPPADSS